MIIRDDLKNSDFYNRAMEMYKKNTWEDINKQLFLTIFFMIVFAIILYNVFQNGGDTSEPISYIVCVVIGCFFYMGYKFWKLTWKYDIYEICVRKKWKNTVNDNTTYWVSEETEKWHGMKAYRVDEVTVYKVLEEGRTYIFLARKNMLHEVVSIKR